MERDFDLAIIGGGIIGACAAWYARKHYPNWKIGILDRTNVNGATHYSASLDLPYGHTPLRYLLARHSGILYEAMRKQLSHLPIRDLSFYGIVQEENAGRVLNQITDRKATLQPGIISSLETEYPDLVIPTGSSIIAGGTAAQAVKNDVAHLLVEDFIKTSDSLVYNNTSVTNVSLHQNIYSLSGTAGVIRSKRVIQATGPWINNILGDGLSALRPARVKKIVAFHIHSQPRLNDPVFYFFDDDAFLMPKPEVGYWLFSFKCDHWDVEPNIDTLSIDENDIQKAQGILEKYYPCFAPLCTEGRVFCDAYASNGDPIIEEAAGHPDYIIAGAGAGSGYRLAPAIAEKALSYFSD